MPKNWCFQTVVLESTLESLVSWTARKSNQSILKETSPECSLEAQMLKLKLQYFGHLMWRVDSLEKIMMLGKTEGRRRRGWQIRDGWMASATQWTWVWASSRRYLKIGKPRMLQYMGSQGVGYDLVTQQQQQNNGKAVLEWVTMLVWPQIRAKLKVEIMHWKQTTCHLLNKNKVIFLLMLKNVITLRQVLYKLTYTAKCISLVSHTK